MVALAIAHGLSAPVVAQESALRLPGLREYVRDVLTENAAYAAARSRAAAAGERIAPAGALPDPILTLGVIAVPVPSFDFDAERMTRVPIGIRQRFPFPGKQGARSDLARADSLVAGETADAVGTGLAAAAAMLFYELAYAGTAVRIWRGRVDLADQAIVVAQARYQTGAVPQTDLLRARLRRARLREQGRGLEAAVLRVRARGDALRRGPGDSVPIVPLVSGDGMPTVVVGDDVFVAEDLMNRLREHSPALQVAAALVSRAERSARIFDIAARPDFTVTIENGIRGRGREPFLTALVGISVPLWSGRKQSPAARAAHHDVEAARAAHEDLVAQLTGEVRDRLANLLALQGRIALTADAIVPLASATSTSALQRYRVGALDFTSVLETQDDLFQVQLGLAQLIAEYGGTRAELAALVGEEWYR